MEEGEAEAPLSVLRLTGIGVEDVEVLVAQRRGVPLATGGSQESAPGY